MPAAAVIPAPIAYINGVEMPYADVAHLCSTRIVYLGWLYVAHALILRIIEHI